MARERQNDFLLVLKTLILLGAVAAFVACGSPDKKEKDKISADEVLHKGGETLELSKGYFSQEKQAFIRSTEARLDTMRRKIERMKKSLASADTASAGLRNQIQDLENKEKTLEDKLEQLKASDVWENVKQGIDSALNELEKLQKSISKRL